MIVQPSTPLEKKELFIEALLNETDKVTKISKHSVLSGFAYGIAKVAQKAEKDIAIHLGYLFPDEADSSMLDQIATMNGFGARFGASSASALVRVVGQAGTIYSKDVNFFKASQNGIQFNLVDDITVPEWGFTYAKVVSNTRGSKTNVEAFSINDVTNKPTGHQFCINEFMAVGGRDVESDELLRRRIKENINRIATGSMSLLEQRALEKNENVLRLFNYGLSADGKYRIAVATQNGIDLSEPELIKIEDYLSEFLSISDSNVFGYSMKCIQLENVKYKLFDVSARVKLINNYKVSDIINTIQININKEYNFTSWEFGKKIEWDNILDIIKDTDGVRYVYDEYFTPQVDITVQRYEVPRLRGFLLLDENGAIIVDNTKNTQLMPLYYPKQADLNQQTLLLR